MKKGNFYITTTIPYVNAEPHIGFALELVQSDAIARYQRLMGRQVFFSTGTDEYGQKIFEASQKEGKNVQDYVDYYAQKFLNLKEILNISNDNFIRTTSKENILAAQEFWRLCDEKGDIEKRIYQGLYCVGCEKFITEKDIIPEGRRQEAMDFVQNAMEDFSISRSVERFSWGIPIPGDDKQVMYVWFGAFINYISTLGWPENREQFKKFWQEGETIQTAGKDMVKFQSVMWIV